MTSQDLDVMYTYFDGKRCLNLWCDGKDQEEDSDEKVAQNKPRRESKRSEKEEELEDVFQQLKNKHGSDFSGPQLRL